MAKKSNFTMNKRVFQALAYLQTTPTIKKEFLVLTTCVDVYGLHLGDVSLGNFTLQDLRKISEFSEPLTGQILLVDVSLPVHSGHISMLDKHVIRGKEDHEDSVFVFLHLLSKVKFNTKNPSPVGVAL